MTKIEALLDTNVILASFDFEHTHYRESSALLGASIPGQYAIAAHAMAEAYSTLTRGGGSGPFNWSPAEAIAALDNVRASTRLLGLTDAQTYDCIRAYALAGGVGPRIYDKLISQVAIVHGIPAIVTWNVGHMRPLFPALAVVTPVEFESGRRTAGQAPANS